MLTRIERENDHLKLSVLLPSWESVPQGLAEYAGENEDGCIWLFDLPLDRLTVREVTK